MSPERSVPQEDSSIKEYQWPNHFRVLLYNIPHARTVSGRLVVRAGPRYEKVARVGVHHYIEHLLPSGTPRHPNYLSFFKFMAQKGIGPDFETNENQSAYSIKIKKENAQEVVPYLFDLIRNPRFYKKDRIREEKRINEEILEEVDDPDENIERIFAKEAWKFFPVGVGVLGKRESLSSVKRRAVVEQEFKKIYRPDNMVLVVVGNFSENEIVSQAGESFGKLVNHGPSRLDSYPAPVYTPNGRHVIIKPRDLEQVQVLLGFPIEKKIVEKNYYGLDLLSTMLGNSINFKLTETYGNAYELKRGSWLYSDFGAIFFSTAVRKKNVSFVVDSMVKEINNQTFDDDEISLMKNIQKTEYVLELEDTAKIAENVADIYLATGETPSIDGLEQKVDSIDPGAPKILYEKVIRKDNAILAMSGRMSKDDAPRFEQKLRFGR